MDEQKQTVTLTHIGDAKDVFQKIALAMASRKIDGKATQSNPKSPTT